VTTTFAIVSTKGGVGKTTEAANLGGICAEFGMRTLLLDGDVQPSLSKYYPLFYRAAFGLTAVITRGGSISADCVSKTSIPNLDIIVSDAPDGALQTWLKDREDRLVILKRAIRSAFVRDNYDVVIIDTQGAVGELQKTAAMAADLMISPVNPSILTAREFASGTLAMLESLNRMSDMSSEFKSGDLMALIYGQDNTSDARNIAALIRNEFSTSGSVRVLDTVVPSSTAYKAAATAQMPVHRFDRKSRNLTSGWQVMHELVWELFPELKGRHAQDVHVGATPTHVGG